MLPPREDHHLFRPKKVLLLGSGGLSIGQAGEFDYSGSQAIKAFLESGVEVVVVNPNIATVQTTPQERCHIYLYPLESKWIERIIEKERPDSIAAGFGGQTALKCLFDLDERGILERYHIRNLGTSIQSLRLSEDRDLFAAQMKKLSLPIAASRAIHGPAELASVAHELGFPLIVRSAYALGGQGSGFANNFEELDALVKVALLSSPQVLVEQSYRGWKEIEYEVMRDSAGNSICICNMENIDPLGIHTGDSMVVAPSQTLDDEDFQRLRSAALQIAGSLEVIGECNVQFALDPKSRRFFVIEMNARLSRSSALASKATGYPIAAIAAQVVLGYRLLDLKNPVTGTTSAFFEPMMDYMVVKMPRWDFSKFTGVSRKLGPAMKSVGEVMAIGRSFPEALQKAARMVTDDARGLSLKVRGDGSDVENEKAIAEATDQRLWALMETARRGDTTLSRLAEITQIDPWFLSHLFHLTEIEKEIANESQTPLASISSTTWKRWKENGFSDQQIAGLLDFSVCSSVGTDTLEERAKRVRECRLRKNIRPFIKKIDTTAGESPSRSNYLYMTYLASVDDEIERAAHGRRAIVLGSGSYRIGTSVEFDWCAVTSSRRLQEHNWESITINCNPETVSTDYNSSDRLYFEEMTLERVSDIWDAEKPYGIIVSMGGQVPNRLALGLSQAGMKLMGHSAETIDLAENRSRFAQVMDEIEVSQPRWTTASSEEEIQTFVEEMGFPVLVRPSYVLSGSAMTTAYNADSLARCLARAYEVSNDSPVVLSTFFENAREIELDGVAYRGTLCVAAVSEHLENAGVHSGDATVSLPCHSLSSREIQKVFLTGIKIAEKLQLHGPFNIQFLMDKENLHVIECNARAARSFPFVSKVCRLNLAEMATDIFLDRPPMKEWKTPILISPTEVFAIKSPLFSFSRLEGADPLLGVEMASTGEVACIAPTFGEALLLSSLAANIRIPRKGVLVSAGRPQEKEKFLQVASLLMRLGLKIYATSGTSLFLKEHGFTSVENIDWPGAGDKDALRAIQEGWVDWVINIPKNFENDELSYACEIRQAAIRFGCSLFTSIEKLVSFAEAIENHLPRLMATHEVQRLLPCVGPVLGSADDRRLQVENQRS